MPPVTTVLLGLNVAVFLAMSLAGVSPLEPSPLQVLKWGANWGPLSLGTQPWRMLASNYIHFGIVHILLNMWCLWNLGLLAERIFDPWTYILTYTACGLGGSLAELVVASHGHRRRRFRSNFRPCRRLNCRPLSGQIADS